MSEQAIEAAMQAAIAAEDRRRELASQTPGLGVLMPMEQPPSGAGVGISDVDMPVVGEGYDQMAEVSGAVHKSYGEARPVYASPAVAGIDYAPLGVGQPALRYGVRAVSPPVRPSLLSRVLARVRGRR